MSNLNDFNREAKAALWVALQWLLLAVPTGLVCGAVGTAFHLAVEHVTEWRADHIWLLWLLPVAGLAIVALYKVTGCEGMGTNNVIRAVHSGESVSPLLVPAIFFGTVLTHLCGGSAGREGAALQMGGSIGYNIAKLFRFSDHDRRTATACGMAAFFSALFGTPLSATLFGIMVEDVGLAFSVAFVPGFAAALIAYVGKIFSPLESLGMEIENIQSAMAGVHRIREFMEEEEMALPAGNGKKSDLPLCISHLSFAYEKGHPLFKDFSLTLESGCHLTLTGRTGSGKSTLFKLITGLCLPDSGTIALFGMNPAAIPPKERRKIFGIVSQSFPMIDGTVRDQITLGDMRITDTMTVSALRISGLYETVMALPQKLDTPFQDSLFSEGEKQLLAIARALVFQPPLLLLDEMNAHLDSLTEQKVFRALSRASSHRTVLSISHRLGKACQGPVLRIGEGRGEGRP